MPDGEALGIFAHSTWLLDLASGRSTLEPLAEPRVDCQINHITLRFTDEALEMAYEQTVGDVRTLLDSFVLFIAAVSILGVLTFSNAVFGISTVSELDVYLWAVLGSGLVAIAFNVFCVLCTRNNSAFRIERDTARVVGSWFLVFIYLFAIPLGSVFVPKECTTQQILPGNVMQATGRACATLLVSIGLHLVHVPFPIKIIACVAPVVQHILLPVWHIGHAEGVIFGAFSGSGALIGYALERSQRNTFLQATLNDRLRREQLQAEFRFEQQRSELERVRLERERQMNEEAVHTISHQLKNRFLALKGLVTSVRGTLLAHAPHMLEAPHHVHESLDDLQGQIHGGVRLCLSESVIRSIAHCQYTRNDAEFDLCAELEQLCGTRIVLNVDDDVPRRIMADLSLIFQVVENFTSNALVHGTQGDDDGTGGSSGKTSSGGSGGQSSGASGYGHATPVRLHVATIPGRCLRISVHNAPGAEHARLRERFGNDASALFRAGLSALESSNAVGTRKGLGIAKISSDLLGGEVGLWIHESSVVATLEFEYQLLPASVRLPPSTLIATLEDSALIRKMDQRLLASGALGVDTESRRHVRGATAEEINTFPEYIMHKMPRRPCLCLIDQNLDHPLHGTEFAKGTDVVRRLREMGYEGELVIKSANHAPDHAKFYAACGADGVVAKGLSALDLNRQLACIHFGLTPGSNKRTADLRSLATVDLRMLEMLVEDGCAGEIADAFMSEMGSVLERLQQATEHEPQRHEEIIGILHSIKGTAANIGAQRVAATCAALHEPMTREEWTQPLRELRVQLEQVFVLLREAAIESGSGHRAGGEIVPV